MLVGIATTNLCLESVGMPSSLFQWVLVTLQFSGGGVSPVLLMKATRAGLAMVTFLSWMANARKSSFIGRALVGIRNGLMLRSVGSNNMFLLVHLLRQEWHVVCQRVCKVHQFLLRGNFGSGGFWAFMFLFSALCILGGSGFAGLHQLCTGLGSRWCASCWTRPWALSGGGITFVTLESKRGSSQHSHAFFFYCFFRVGDVSRYGKPCMLSLAGQPSLLGYDAFMVCRIKGTLRGICRQKHCKTSFSPFRVFLFSQNSRVWFWGLILWLLWVGRARHPGPTPILQRVGVEVFNVGGWLTHGDLSLEVGVDFLAVVEHRLLPARVRSEWSRLRSKGLSSIWAPASQDSYHSRNAGVGVISMKGAFLALPTFATAQFRSFFGCGRAVRCMLPLGSGRFMHACFD